MVGPSAGDSPRVPDANWRPQARPSAHVPRGERQAQRPARRSRAKPRKDPRVRIGLWASSRAARRSRAEPRFGSCEAGAAMNGSSRRAPEGNTYSLSSKRRPSASRILRFVSIRQFMPFSTLWMVRSATRAFRASWAWVINRFSRSSRTRFGCRALLIITFPVAPVDGAMPGSFGRRMNFFRQIRELKRAKGTPHGREALRSRGDEGLIRDLARGDARGAAGVPERPRVPLLPSRRVLRAARPPDRSRPGARLRGRSRGGFLVRRALGPGAAAGGGRAPARARAGR